MVTPSDKGRYVITVQRDDFMFPPVTVVARTIQGALLEAWRLHKSHWQAGQEDTK